ncbi:AGCS family alanine or glycine:cation symporter [Catalinimonas alkaloidigena]|uniref:alanine/glycine:cation symporter family protein n=1 Tax=Catalinimonas alkaloidigena TaxID=1075417 RepID=UPI002404914E|nr:alanine/glycine:cation symporter family protein [Catalinimonas alkaloidigena]MDF9797010.1 AGCS family alanine or glycine:cation symporter [Catalinimonas alkaloidigena]
MKLIELILSKFSEYAWGTHLLILLLGGGMFFMLYSRFLPFRYLGHAINVLRGKYDDPDEPGEISHFEALSSALAATVGMGNIGGVAVAITMGGPGALFWMWVSAFLGMATKFFTCSLAIMYRGHDSAGKLQGGPMYVIEEGLGKKWKPLAMFFAIAGLFGPLPVFQANQLTQIFRDVVLIPNDIIAEETLIVNLISGIVIAFLVSIVIFGGIKRIARVASQMVPGMVVIYVLSVVYIITTNLEALPECFALILTDAFSGKAVLGGSLGAVIVIGARRAAFSNEAGIGTAPLAHGAAKTKEPIREGLVAMLGPAIDTLIVCTMTALAILITDVWRTTDADGVTLTVNAFNKALPTNNLGGYLLVLSVLTFSLSSLFTLSYYGTKCFSYIAGAHRAHYFNYFYVFSIILGSVASISAIINLVDGMYGLMAIPTMISALLLAPKVRDAAKKYFDNVDHPTKKKVIN